MHNLAPFHKLCHLTHAYNGDCKSIFYTSIFIFSFKINHYKVCLLANPFLKKEPFYIPSFFVSYLYGILMLKSKYQAIFLASSINKICLISTLSTCLLHQECLIQFCHYQKLYRISYINLN